MCHLGNASYRTGKMTRFDKKKNAFAGNTAASETFARMEDHLAHNGVSLEESEYRLGQALTLPDQKSWKTTDENANDILSGKHQYREPFMLPEELLTKA